MHIRAGAAIVVAAIVGATAVLPHAAAEDGPAGRAATVAAAAATTFADVTDQHPFFGHITWLAEQGIAGGYADGTFGSARPVSRAAMAAFLRRIADADGFEPPGTATFADVGPSHPFFVDVEWLAQAGIADGYADGRFGPSRPVSRGAMAAFLHRATAGTDTGTGAPAPTATTFVDVPPSHPFAADVEWLVAEDVAEVICVECAAARAAE